MGEYTANDSDGVQHFIWLQERDQSCGPACIYMIERDFRQANTVAGEERIRFISSLLPGGYNERTGTMSGALAETMNRVGFQAAHRFVSDMTGYVPSATGPVICHIRWPNGGGHFTVCKRRTTHNSNAFCDPWYGLVEPQDSQLPAYRPTTDARGGTTPSGSGGRLSGYVIELLATPNMTN